MPGDRRSFDPRWGCSARITFSTCSASIRPARTLWRARRATRRPGIVSGGGRCGLWLRQLSKILKFVPKLSDLAKAYDELWNKSIDLKRSKSTTQAPRPFPNSPAQMERSARRELDVVMGKEVEAEGAAPCVLHVFLREVDKTQHWCRVERVATNDGNTLWLCAEHAWFHEV